MSTPTTPAQISAFLNGPAATPPAGITPNLGPDAPNLNGAFIATLVVCIPVATILVFLRLYTRFGIIQKHDLSDYLVAGTYISFLALTVLLCIHISLGGGRHTWDVRVKDVGGITYYFLMAAMSYDICMILIKTAILYQYRVLFVPQRKRNFMWWSTWSLTGLIWIFYITAGLIQIFFCTPVQKTWDPTVSGTCLDESPTRLNVISSAFNIAIDAITLVLPLVSISRLHLDAKRRAGIASIFGIGIFACISAGLRLYYSYLVSTQPDALYYVLQLALWAYAEATSGIMIACMPMIPRFVQKTLGESKLYNRIVSSLRSLVSSRQSRGSRDSSNDYYSAGNGVAGSRYNPRDDYRRAKTSGSLEEGSEDFELAGREHIRHHELRANSNNHTGNEIVRTIDIQSSRA